jgi:hypothetical protein
MSEGRTVAVPSSSRPGVTHYVSVENDHRYHCTCESFTYRRYCRHTDEAPASYGQRVAVFGYTPTPRVTLADLTLACSRSAGGSTACCVIPEEHSGGPFDRLRGLRPTRLTPPPTERLRRTTGCTA